MRWLVIVLALTAMVAGCVGGTTGTQATADCVWRTDDLRVEVETAATASGRLVMTYTNVRGFGAIDNFSRDHPRIEVEDGFVELHRDPRTAMLYPGESMTFAFETDEPIAKRQAWLALTDVYDVQTRDDDIRSERMTLDLTGCLR